jgi:hypothetical protein
LAIITIFLYIDCVITAGAVLYANCSVAAGANTHIKGFVNACCKDKKSVAKGIVLKGIILKGIALKGVLYHKNRKSEQRRKRL